MDQRSLRSGPRSEPSGGAPRGGTPGRARRRAALPLGALLLLAACGGGGGGGSDAPAFFLESSTPAHGAIGVAVDVTVRAVFSLPVDPASVGADALTVSGAGQGVLPGICQLLDDGEGRTLEWSGAQLLASGRLHTARTSLTLRSTTGQALPQAALFSFQTIFNTPPLDLPLASQLGQTNGALHTGRAAHQATLLFDGRVLITGGFAQGTTPAETSELYVPQTGLFVETAQSPGVARASHTATRLADGRVLVAGGWVETTPGVLSAAESAEIYDPSAGTWTAVGPLRTARAEHAALLLPDGRVLLTGGSQLSDAGLVDLDDAEFFDPGTLTFSTHPNRMLHTRAAHVMVRLGDGRILLAGGSFDDLRAEGYDPVTGTFAAFTPAAQDGPRFGAMGAVFADGDAAVAGGDALGTVLHCFTAFARMQNTGSGLSRPRAYGSATPIAPDQILVAGGIDFSRGGFLEASCDALVRGGLGGSRTFVTEVRFPHGLAQHTATVLASGDVLFCGGVNEDGFQANHREAFLLDLTP